MKHRLKVFGFFALTTVIAMPLFQNMTFEKQGERREGRRPSSVIVPPVTLPSSNTSDVSIDLGSYGLVGTQTFSIPADPSKNPKSPYGKTDDDDRALSTNYQSFLSYQNTTDVQKDDVFVIMAVAEMTHQPAINSTSMATVSAYLDCSGKRVSPFNQKSLMRSKGNHHASMLFNGLCRISSVPAGGVSIQLFAKSSLSNGLIHGGSQTKLIVNQYRMVLGDQDRTSLYFPVSSLRQPGMDKKVITPGGTQTKTLVQSVDLNLLKGDLVYVTSQVQAEEANADIPMFGLYLSFGTSTLASATENVVPNDLSKITQNLVGFTRARSDMTGTVSTSATALETSNTSGRLSLVGAQSDLGVLIYRQDPRKKNVVNVLNRFVQKNLISDLSILGNGLENQIGTPTRVVLDRPGILRIQASSTLLYNSRDFQNCRLQSRVTSASGSKSNSAASVRRFKSPYSYHTIANDFILPVKVAGTYDVSTFVQCDRTSSTARITVPKSGTSSLIEVFEQE